MAPFGKLLRTWVHICIIIIDDFRVWGWLSPHQCIISFFASVAKSTMAFRHVSATEHKPNRSFFLSSAISLNGNRHFDVIATRPHKMDLYSIYFIIFFHVIHFIIPFGKFGPPYMGKTTAAARAALPSPLNNRL